MSTLTGPVIAPNCAPLRAECATSALRISFLLGMHAMFGQAPPTHLRSTTAVRRPDPAICQAISFPAVPLPRIRTSNCSGCNMRLLRLCHSDAGLGRVGLTPAASGRAPVHFHRGGDEFKMSISASLPAGRTLACQCKRRTGTLLALRLLAVAQLVKSSNAPLWANPGRSGRQTVPRRQAGAAALCVRMRSAAWSMVASAPGGQRSRQRI